MSYFLVLLLHCHCYCYRIVSLVLFIALLSSLLVALSLLLLLFIVLLLYRFVHCGTRASSGTLGIWELEGPGVAIWEVESLEVESPKKVRKSVENLQKGEKVRGGLPEGLWALRVSGERPPETTVLSTLELRSNRRLS